MQKKTRLSLQIAGTVALATLVGTSAFAESRHLGGTRGLSPPPAGRMAVRAPRFGSRVTPAWHSAPRFGSRATPAWHSAPRFGSRVTPAWHSAPRFGSRVAPTWHGAPRFGRSVPFRGPNFYNSGSRFYGRGRIDRIVPYPGGYRVWLGGWGYPFFVPYRFYNPYRFRIGLFIGFNAFYHPFGYYNVYGAPYAMYPYYRGPYYGGSYYGGGDDRYDNRYDNSVVRGIVESIDLRTGYVTINDDTSRRSVRALLPPRDRRVDDIRVGDYVEFSGQWVRNRDYDFDADRMERFEPRR